MALRNVGNGIAVLHGWRFYPGWHRDEQHAPLEEFERQNRDLYIPPGDIGFWQGAFRTRRSQVRPARKVIEREPWTVELLYGDHEGGQRAITRFTSLPLDASDTEPEGGWLASQSRHWNRPARSQEPDHPGSQGIPSSRCDF